MGNLQQVVEGLHDIRVGAVGVLKIQTAVLLDIKALVFDVPAHPASLAGNGANIFLAEPKVRHPGEGLLSFWAAFLAEQCMDSMDSSLVVFMFQIIDPAKALLGFIGQSALQAV